MNDTPAPDSKAPKRPEQPKPDSEGKPKSKPRLIFDDPLDQQSADDTDGGWGERPASGGNSAADLARFLDEKPPHHL